MNDNLPFNHRHTLFLSMYMHPYIFSESDHQIPPHSSTHPSQVRHKKTGNVYAMKIFKKSELRRRRQVERTLTERDIMSRVKHPFIVQLSFAFQTAEKVSARHTLSRVH